MRMSHRLYLLPLLLLSLFFLSACQSPCSRSPLNGYTRYFPQEGLNFRLQFDYPSAWELKPAGSPDQGLVIERPDALNPGRSVLVLMDLAPAEQYPNIVTNGRINSKLEWGDPFPSQIGKKITRKEVSIDGNPALKVSIDFAAPVLLVGTETPVNSWGYMQTVYIVARDMLYDVRFYASDTGEEARLRSQFDKLLASVCVLP